MFDMLLDVFIVLPRLVIMRGWLGGSGHDFWAAVSALKG